MNGRPRFWFDTNSPYSYLAAMRVDELLGADVEWVPIAFAFLLRAQQREPWSFHEATRVPGQRECEQRAHDRGLPPMLWPPEWPKGSYSLEPLRAITAAMRHGRERELARAIFARNFVTAEGVRDSAVVQACWAQAGLDPARYGDELEQAKPALTAATEAAIAAGVPGVPTVTVAGEHFWGDDRLEQAASALARA